jgi:signal transduction histidine kinase
MPHLRSREEAARGRADVELAMVEASSVVAAIVVAQDGTILGANTRMRRFVGTFVDGDDSKALRVTAQHSARMEALASLTAGVAHDFNNLLTVLVGNLSLIGEDSVSGRARSRSSRQRGTPANAAASHQRAHDVRAARAARRWHGRPRRSHRRAPSRWHASMFRSRRRRCAAWPAAAGTSSCACAIRGWG